MYENIPFWRFALAVAVASVPAAIMEAQGHDDWAWRYTLVILVMLVIVHPRGISAFMGFISRELR